MTSDFFGVNAAYVLDLYERYQQDPASVDAEARAFFAQWTPPAEAESSAVIAERREQPALAVEKIVGAANLAQAIRANGHFAANLDPLGTPPPGDPSLNPAFHGIGDDDLRQLPASLIGGPLATQASNALWAIQLLRAVYSSASGYEFDHVHEPAEREWLREAVESGQYRPPLRPINARALLERLTQVETFEQFLHRIFPGKHRFSIEGLDIMVPMLDEIIYLAAEADIANTLLGMAHRGRLNVLAHTLNKPYLQFLAEFKDPVNPRKLRYDLGWMGDVKYHAGAYRTVTDSQQIDMLVTMAPNPSHLEMVNPVVEGMARAVGTRSDAPGAPRFDPEITLPLLIHGDAAFPGQGIVSETLNLSRLPGYWTGGTIHIISNNQLGYTTEPSDSRSTLYASDLAKGFRVPVVHVNADDPQACIEAARLAYAYRAHFHKDFLIDLIGYRRYGHNEGDEPGFTQPRQYQQIRQHPTVRQLWANTLVERRIIAENEADALVRQHMDNLQKTLESLNPDRDLREPELAVPTRGLAGRQHTAVSLERLQALNEALRTLPPGFSMHPKLQKAIQGRREAFKDAAAATIDWATAEELAFATILQDGVAIRMTGQDVERGTFNQRHAVFHDAENGAQHIPLQRLPQATAAFEIHNSPLTEAATIGFEYGYNIQEPGRLVLWEAQYGDFINGAQGVIDEFLVSARDKWGQTPSLVLLLPHGYEGAGPDHSTGRLERFLQLAADINMRVANPTTAAQYFHLLRRQTALLKSDPLPLIIMTPKSLLRHPLVASPPRAFAEGHWQAVIDDARAAQQPERIRRLVLCSGKIYVDLLSSPYREQDSASALVRVEQLYPLREDELGEIFRQYTQIEEVIWAQEEPENAGAWEFMRPHLLRLSDRPLRYIGRPRRSSPAEGSAAWHAANQEALIERVYAHTREKTAPLLPTEGLKS
ncbi:MAG: 2-oxoglutarate dehydrogenase E1 component [Chloroflexi bacterium]|nr:2-oxoglutarate dehydrogenase E1 component [Chloroflexota bacterium]